MISQKFHTRLIFFIISLAMFMEGLDASIINTAIPTMAHSLNENPIDLKIALISYLLSLAVFIPISGWVADRLGAKRVFIWSAGIFTVSSLWCGISHSLVMLVIARVFQGIGGAFTIPVGRLMLVRMVPRNEYVVAMNRIVTVASLSIMLGPVLGGLITHYFSWRWIFFINIPVGLFTMIMAGYFFTSTKVEHVPPLDKLGFILFGCSLASFTFGLSAFSETYISDKPTVIIVLCSIALFICYWWHSRKQSHPVFNTKLLQLRTFRISFLANLFARIGLGGIPFLLPLLLQIVMGYSAQVSGLLLAPTAVGVLLSKRAVVRLLRFGGYKYILMANTFFLSLSLISFAIVKPTTSLYLIAFLTLIYGFFSAIQFSSGNSLGYTEISKENFSSATSILSTLQQVAQSFGVAIAALGVRLFSEELTRDYTLSMKAFHNTFIALGIITFLSIIVYFPLKRNDGHEMIDRTQ